MRQRRLLLIVLAPAVLIAGMLAHLLWFHRGQPLRRDRVLYVNAKGELIDAETGVGIARAWVLGLPEWSGTSEPEMLMQYRRWKAEVQAWRQRDRLKQDDVFAGPGHFLAAGETRADGTFGLSVSMRWSCNEVAGTTRGSARPPERDGAKALLIELEGKEPQVIGIDASIGTWTTMPRSDGLCATWDLGRIELRGTD